jgi:hypothetical protein
VLPNRKGLNGKDYFCDFYAPIPYCICSTKTAVYATNNRMLFVYIKNIIVHLVHCFSKDFFLSGDDSNAVLAMNCKGKTLIM